MPATSSRLRCWERAQSLDGTSFAGQGAPRPESNEAFRGQAHLRSWFSSVALHQGWGYRGDFDQGTGAERAAHNSETSFKPVEMGSAEGREGIISG